MEGDRRDRESPAIHPAIPIAVVAGTLVALAGALAYLGLSGHSGTRESIPSAHPANAAPAPAPAVPTGHIRLTVPSSLRFTSRFVELQARATGGVDDVRLEYRTQRSSVWSPIPEERLSTESDEDVDLPLDTDARGNTALVRWDMPATIPDDRDAARENTLRQDGAISIRAVARRVDGQILVSATEIAVLLSHGPPPVEPVAPSIDDDAYAYSAEPIRVAWSAPTFTLPDGRTIDVPVAGYAVDLVNKDDLDSGWVTLPPGEIATTSTSFDVRPPVQNDHPHVIVIRPIDAAGNVGAARSTRPFLSQSLALALPRTHAVFHGDAPVPLLALNASAVAVCFEYRAAGPKGEGTEYVPIPPGEVTNAADKPLRGWPLRIARTGTLLHWHGLRHAREIGGHAGRAVEIRVVTTAPGDCEGTYGGSQIVTITWRR